MNGIDDIGTAAPLQAYYNLSNNKTSGYEQTINDLNSMADSLSKAAENAPLANQMQTLNSLVKQCEMLNRMMYTAKSWNALMKAYARGKKLSMDDNPSLKTIKKTIAELSAALAALEQAQKAETEEDERKESLPLVLKLGTGNTQTDTAAAISSGSAVGTTEAAEAFTGSIDVSL